MPRNGFGKWSIWGASLGVEPRKICVAFASKITKSGTREVRDAIAGSGICRVRLGCARRLAAVRHRAGWPAGGRTQFLLAGLPDGRSQAAHHDRPLYAGRGAFLRLGG